MVVTATIIVEVKKDFFVKILSPVSFFIFLSFYCSRQKHLSQKPQLEA